MNTMKIAINCQFCQPKGGGIKEYIVNLTNGIAAVDDTNTYVLYVLEDQLEFARSLLPSKFKLKTIPYKSNFLSVVKRSLFSRFFWLQEEQTEQFDIFHSPFFHAPKLKKAKLVITVHDLRLYRFPKTYNYFRYQFLKRAVKDAIHRADRIISISDFTKSEILALCDTAPEKITVIHEAINRRSFSSDLLASYQLPADYSYLADSRFLFSLGHIEPRKNYQRLIEAFKMLRNDPRNADLKLVIAGKPYVDTAAVIKLIDETDNVVYLNFIPRELLLWLYKNAALFVFPSYYEGFGFPPLEAASLGTLSAVSNVSSIPEVCGECAFYFDPYNTSDMARVIDTALNSTDERREKAARIEPQLNSFSWVKNAEETVRLYTTIANQQN